MDGPDFLLLQLQLPQRLCFLGWLAGLHPQYEGATPKIAPAEVENDLAKKCRNKLRHFCVKSFLAAADAIFGVQPQYCGCGWPERPRKASRCGSWSRINRKSRPSIFSAGEIVASRAVLCANTVLSEAHSIFGVQPRYCEAYRPEWP